MSNVKKMVLGPGEVLAAIQQYLEDCADLPAFTISKAFFRGLMSKVDVHLHPGERWDPLQLWISLELEGASAAEERVASISPDEPGLTVPPSSAEILKTPGEPTGAKKRRSKKPAQPTDS